MANLKSKNLNYIYHKEYYKDIDFFEPKAKSSIEKERNKENPKKNAYKLDRYNNGIMEIRCPSYHIAKKIAPQYFELRTLSPGLLTGIGSLHSIGADDEFSLGFNFDYVTGTPYIPGSTVKGVLCAAFENADLIKSLLNNDNIDVEKLRNNIFEGVDYSSEEEEKLPSTKKDIFFDVYPCGGKQPYFDEDYITPHGNDLTKNPIPIKLLKLKPDIIFDFRFRLHEFKSGDSVLDAEGKKELFKKIILLTGIGAKTNVGYGAFSEETDEKNLCASERRRG